MIVATLPSFLPFYALQDRSALGGRNAAHDAMTAISALCAAPEWSISEGACAAVVKFNGLKPMVDVSGGSRAGVVGEASVEGGGTERWCQRQGWGEA